MLSLPTKRLESFKFYKYQACGNDFILIEDDEEEFLQHHRSMIPHLCKPHYGIGADGVLLVQKSTVANIKMRIFNQDGSEARMCGNGLRCVGKHFGQDCSIETAAGVSILKLRKDSIHASLPIAKILKEFIDLPMNLKGHLVNTGTEHLVIFVEDIHAPDLSALADLYKTHELFSPKGVNVNYAKILSQDSLQVKTFEKGVKEPTHSCGSGGAAVALAYTHLIERQETLRILSWHQGEILYSIDSLGTLWMTGPAQFVFEGNFISKKLFMD